MSLSRRGFVRTLGLGTAGVLSSSFVIGRGREAAAFDPQSMRVDDEVLRIGSNENARGPGASAIQALHEVISPRLGRGYPPDHVAELATTIAETEGVERENVVVGTGSNPLLAASVHAFTSADRPLVTGSPTYGSPESAARRKGVRVRAVRVNPDLSLDLDGMATAAPGAGLLFLCNPNNPTGMAYRSGAVEDFVRLVKRRSPETTILIDEAYMDYTYDPDVRTAVPLALEIPGVFVTRTFSKAHGMAGLRVGYAIGQAETVSALSAAWHLGSMNALSAAAATASLKDSEHIAAERVENAAVRDLVMSAFRSMGYDGPDSHANCVFVDLGRPASWFREQCLARGVQVGRDFPPFESSHSRISLGTREEMERAVEVFRAVLTA
ncbi:MAG: aminotransferase class I/II-fold pyridoxal phosphate-dependent enzyme [Gemmatimonadota bacterium]